MGKFVVRKVKTGIMFNLKAGNGEVIATSEVYSSEASCMKGIASVVKNAPIAALENQTVEGFAKEKCPKFEVYVDKAGEYRFRLYAINGLCVCHSSHGYSTKGGCKGGIDSIKRFAKEASVDKSYLK